MLALHRALLPRRRRRLLLVVLVLAGSAAAELLTIGAVLPLLALVADPARAADVPGLSLFAAWAGGGSPELLLRKAAALLVGAAVVSAALRLLTLRLSQNFVAAVAHDLGAGAFARILRQPFAVHAGRNSSALLATAEKLQMLTSGVLLPLVQGAAAAAVALAIAALLLLIDPAMAAAAAGTIGLLYFLLGRLFRGRLRANAAGVAGAASARIRIWREALGSIRDVLLDGTQPAFEKRFRELDRSARRAQSFAWFAAAAPRPLVEAAGIALIGLLALLLPARPGGFAAALPVLAVFAFGAQRLLPLVQQMYQAAAQVTAHQQVLRDVLALTQLPVPPAPPPGGTPPLPFAQAIALEGVGFRFDGRPEWALRGVDLLIPRGARIGVVGPSGSGKSTLFDLLMGLLEPTSGRLLVDGAPLDARSRAGWQRQVAHVPQNIYLLDASVAANIALGEAEEAWDWPRLEAAAARAQLGPVLAALPDGLRTPVGERGARLSGGERQRVGIARALYKRAAVLILDEATAALDRANEAAVIGAITEGEPELTVLIAAHQPSALARCDRIVRLDGGRLVGDEAVGRGAVADAAGRA